MFVWRTVIFSLHAAEDILKEFRERFISEMDASTVAMEMFHYQIIPNGVLESIAKADNQRQQNSILHDCLLRTCTNEALMRACDIITSVQGNPKMSVLGKDMRRRLESGVCVCACMHVCVWCVCLCVVCVCLYQCACDVLYGHSVQCYVYYSYIIILFCQCVDPSVTALSSAIQIYVSHSQTPIPIAYSCPVMTY